MVCCRVVPDVRHGKTSSLANSSPIHLAGGWSSRDIVSVSAMLSRPRVNDV